MIIYISLSSARCLLICLFISPNPKVLEGTENGATLSANERHIKKGGSFKVQKGIDTLNIRKGTEKFQKQFEGAYLEMFHYKIYIIHKNMLASYVFEFISYTS